MSQKKPGQSGDALVPRRGGRIVRALLESSFRPLVLSTAPTLPTQLYVVAMLAAMKAGAAYIPLVDGEGATSARHCRLARPGLLLVEDGASAGELHSLRARVVTSSELHAVLLKDVGGGGERELRAAEDPWCADRGWQRRCYGSPSWLLCTQCAHTPEREEGADLAARV